MDQIHIFISSSDKDSQFREEFKKHLKPLLRGNKEHIKVWDHHKIVPGDEWDNDIRQELDKADIILFLVSPDSLASDYVSEKEMAIALQRQERGEAVVISVLLRPCYWQETPLSKFEVLPEKAKFITLWKDRDDAFNNVIKGLHKVVDRINERRAFAKALSHAAELFEQQNWTKAASAYQDSIDLHQTGFVPEKGFLLQQLDNCLDREQLALKARAFEAKKAEFHKELARADLLFGQKNWSQALQQYRLAGTLYDPGFPATTASKRIAKRVKDCETAIHDAEMAQAAAIQRHTEFDHHLKNAESQWRRKNYDKALYLTQQALALFPDDVNARQLRDAIENASNNTKAQESGQNPASASSFRPVWVGVLSVFGASVLFFALSMLECRSCSGRNAPASPPEIVVDSNAIALQVEDSLFRRAHSLPEWRAYIERYPNGRHRPAAEAAKRPLEMRLDSLLIDADIIGQDDTSVFYKYINSARQIDSNDTRIPKILKKHHYQ